MATLGLIVVKLDEHSEQLTQISEQIASLAIQAAGSPGSLLALTGSSDPVSLPSDVVPVHNPEYIAMYADDSTSEAASRTVDVDDWASEASEHWTNDDWDRWASQIAIPKPDRSGADFS